MDWNRLEFGNGLEQVGNGLEQVGTVWNRLKLIDRACLRVKKSRMRLLRVTTVYSVQNLIYFMQYKFLSTVTDFIWKQVQCLNISFSGSKMAVTTTSYIRKQLVHEALAKEAQ